jgi:hypothetical protein
MMAIPGCGTLSLPQLSLISRQRPIKVESPGLRTIRKPAEYRFNKTFSNMTPGAGPLTQKKRPHPRREAVVPSVGRSAFRATRLLG